LNYRLENIIDVDNIRALLESFSEATDIVTAILDIDGNILVSAGWRDICTKFNRPCPETAKRCTESDTVLAGKLASGADYSVYECLNGLVDIAVPIIVDGEHIGNLFTGQFLFEAPDPDRFRKQAAVYGFDEDAYLDALSQVPVISESQAKLAVTFLLNMTRVLAEMGLSRIRQIESAEALRKSETLYRTLLEQAADAIFIADPNGRFQLANSRACALFGYSAEEFGELSIPAVVAETDVARQRDEFQRVIAGERLLTERLFQCKDGSVFPGELSVCHMEGGLVLGIVRDITKRKRAEELLRQEQQFLAAVFDSIEEGIVACDAQGILTRFNRATREFHGLPQKSISPIEWAEHYDLYLPDGQTPMSREDIPLFRALNGENVHNVEMMIIPKRGRARSLEASGQALRDPEGRVIGAVVAMHDITARKQVEEAIRSQESFTRTILDNLPIGLAVNSVSPDVRFEYMNDNFPAFYRVTKDDLRDPDTFWEAVYKDPAYREFMRKRVLEDCASGDLARMHWADVSLIREGEPATYIEAQNVPIPDTNLMLSMVWDITERKRAEAELVESERRFRKLFENMTAGFVLFEVVQDDDGVPVDLTILAANKEFERTTALKIQDMTGKRLTQVLPGIERDAADWIGTYGKVAQTGESRQFEQGSELLGCYYSVTAYQSGPNQCAVAFLDVTEHRKAQLALQASEERFRRLFAQAPVGIALVHSDSGRFVEINQEYCDILGLSEAEALREDFSAVTHPEDLPEDLHNMDHLKAGEIDWYEMEKRYVRKDGTHVWAALTVVALQHEGVRLDHHMAIAEDITARKRAEEALRESEERFASAFHTSPAAITITRIADGRFVDVNQAFLDLFEFPRDEVIDHTSTELGILNAEERASLIQAQLESGGLRHAEFLARSKSGRPVHLLFSSKPMSLSGEPHHVTTLIDITERRETEQALQDSERKLREAQQLAHLGHWTWDVESGDVEWSEEVYRIFGLDPEKFTPQIESILALSPWPEDHQRGKELIDRAIQSHEPGSYEQKFLLPDGSSGYYFSTFLGSYDDVGNLVAIRGTVQDITDRKRMDEELAKHRDHLEDLVEERTAELAKMSAEQRTILDSVRAMIWFKDTENRHLRVNKAVAESVGLPVEEIEGKLCEELFPKEAEHYHQDDLEVIQSGESKLGIEEPLHAASGEKRWLLTDKIPYRDEAGNIVGIVVLSLDITERKEAEEALRSRSAELQVMVNAMADRELRMVELKKAIGKLRAQLEQAGIEPIADKFETSILVDDA
jgi:PAS domain S-box-containing protein